MQPANNIAVRAARQAREELLIALDKSQPDLADPEACAKQLAYLNKLCYKIIFDSLKRSFPKAYIAEQDVFHAHNAESSWHISNIQSADNFLRRIPACTLSITNKIANKTEHALVINLFTGEEFSASRGRGAELDDKKMRVSKITHLDQAKVVTNLVYQRAQAHPQAMALFQQLQEEAQSIHITGSAVLDINYVAAGKADLAVLSHINKDDLSAALLICAEAGALNGDFKGAPLSDNSREVIVANPRLFKTALQQINKTLSPL